MMWEESAAGLAIFFVLCMPSVLAMSLWTHEKWRLKGLLILAVLPLLLLVLGRLLLNAWGLAWRSWVQFCLVIGLTVGILTALILGAIWIWNRLLAVRWRLWRYLSRLLIVALTCGLGLIVAWEGFLISAFSASSERVMTLDGRRVVEVRSGFTDICYTYYNYYGPLIRGSTEYSSSRFPLEAD